MNTQETRKSDAIRFINTVVKARRMLIKRYASLDEIDVGVIDSTHYKEQHISNLDELAELVNIPIISEEWDGNEICNASYNIHYFTYKGIKFFGLYDKEDKSDERK